MITVRDVALAASEIIFANEGGYTSINKNDNGALSIGKLQWHGERARDLLCRICANDKELQASLGGIWSEVSGGVSFKERILSDAEAELVRVVLASDKSKEVQDSLSIEDIILDIERGVGYGLSNCGALMYFADGANQYGRYSALWKSAAEQASGVGGTLEDLHNAILSLSSSRIERRKRTYEKIKKTEIADCYLGEERDMSKNTVIYKVARGDTLSAIALKYSSDIDLIVKENKGQYPSITRNYIVTGWNLKIPKCTEESEYEKAVSALKKVGILDESIPPEKAGETTVIMLYRMMKMLSEGSL